MKGFDFWYFWSLLAKNWKFVFSTSAIGGALALGYTIFWITPLYTATATLYVGRGERSVIESGVTRQLDDMRLLNSELVTGLQLTSDYVEIARSKRIMARAEELIKLNSPKYMDLRFGFDAVCVPNTRMLVLKVVSPSRVGSQVVCNTVADVFVEEISEIFNLQNSQVIDRADTPTVPSYPSRRKNTMLGCLIGAVLAYLLVFLRSIQDTSVRTPEAAMALLKLPLMGNVPLDDTLKNADDETLKPGDRILSVHHNERERMEIGESFRTLRANIQYSEVPHEPGVGHVFVTTSTLPGEGKSFTAANLAASLADSGKRTLAVNCDLHKPSLAKFFGVSPDGGLVNVLVGEKSFDDVVCRNLLDLPLDVLFCGPVPPNPSRLLLSDKFKELIKEQQHNYDYIILDAPPCLNIADAAIVGGLSDGILFVIQAGRARGDTISRAYQQLSQLKLPVLGLVLNKFTVKDLSGYAYGYGYGFGYGYGYGSGGYGYGYGYGGYGGYGGYHYGSYGQDGTDQPSIGERIIRFFFQNKK
ncbi:MAG: polysaccharide biosynthesis tyrosine autokinase [Victivallaceae bacterium]|nr:polysaccharide biosynthesis tyrosine autokinase [Victivallaceae bacterium]